MKRTQNCVNLAASELANDDENKNGWHFFKIQIFLVISRLNSWRLDRIGGDSIELITTRSNGKWSYERKRSRP